MELLPAEALSSLRLPGAVSAGDVLGVGVSGGPDSVALLDALVTVRSQLGIDLRVVHFNHGLRGEEADADAEWVRSLAESYGLPVAIGRDEGAVQGQLTGRSEAAARTARYRYFARAMSDLGLVAIATGHTADDQAETVLLRLVRGTGSQGLAAMRPVTSRAVRTDDGRLARLRVLRPLLGVRRPEVLSYLAARQLDYRVDRTNASPAYTRNRVRAELLPWLQAENPRIVEGLCRLAGLAADDYDYLQATAEASLTGLARRGSGRVECDLPGWQALPRALRRAGLRQLYLWLVGDTQDLEQVHVEDALRLLDQGRAGSALDWPGGTRVIVGYGSFAVATRIPTSTTRLESTPLPVPGSVGLPAGRRLEACVRPGRCAWSRNARDHADLSEGSVVGGLRVRSRRAGDRLVPLGLSGSKKVQDVLSDAKVPRSERDAVPVVEDDAGIVWVAGVTLADRCRVKDDWESVICVRLRSDQPTDAI